MYHPKTIPYMYNVDKKRPNYVWIYNFVFLYESGEIIKFIETSSKWYYNISLLSEGFLKNSYIHVFIHPFCEQNKKKLKHVPKSQISATSIINGEIRTNQQEDSYDQTSFFIFVIEFAICKSSYRQRSERIHESKFESKIRNIVYL